ncbi:hypothetical protein niasHT_005834 [Heterodera trifolii]|uniref:Uncharacterized protein n=1 Tax=Heterodera trifolii TaxID=157864 RepID=A0ABD2LU30_9BILA
MRPRRINFPRARTTAAGFMTDCQVDLADFQALSRHNSGNRYLMVLFDEEEVEKYESTHSEKKAALAERAIRQIKNRVYRYFAQTKTLNWVDVIDQIVDGINKSPNRVHGMRPIDVNFKNSQQIWEKMFGEYQHRALFGKHRKRAKFVPGQTVRMSIAKGQFEKGYIPNYGDEILEIDRVKRHKKPMQYKLRDAKGEKFKGFFYPEELAPVRRNAETTYRIERVFRKRKIPDGTMEVLNYAESLESIIKNNAAIRRKRSAIDPTSPPSARIVPKSPPNVTKKVIVPTSPPRVGQKNEENSEESLTNVTKPPEKQQKIEKQPEVVRSKSEQINQTQNITHQNTPTPKPPQPASIPTTKKHDELKSTIDPTPSVSNPPPPVPVSNPVDQNKNVSINQSVSQKINIPPPSVSSSSINVTKKQEELQNSNGPTVSNPPPQLPVTNQTTVSPVNQITPAKTNYTKPSSSLINEEKLKEIGPPPKQRTEKSTVETVSPTLPPAVPTHSNVTVKKATSPPRVIATDIIGPPPKQRNEKSINTKHVQAQLVNEIIPETTKKTTITTTTTTTITEPPKDTIDDFIEQIEEPSERNNAERLLSVLFGNEEWKKMK